MKFAGYELDAFQERAIESIKGGRSVIVSAPTGAGKTVIAEYAIEQAIRNGQEIVYTAPIKALSNQKYRDFSERYPGKVGVMTGDVILNPTAPALIMTTEIFRNIVFESDSDRLRDVRYVIFDEIHYINDTERGTVWEESIIFAPQHIGFICLSATIPNFEEFAHWIARVRDIEIDSVVETHRPVPLSQSLYVRGAGFRDLKDLKEMETQKKQFLRVEKRRGRKDSTAEVIFTLKKKGRLPALFFCFSRVGCREYAVGYRDLNLLSRDERDRALEEYDRLCEKFGIAERGSVAAFRELIAAGVCYHHAGILPALKEIIERLYTRKLIKLLFTTETFAVGINMPARTVLFDNLTKHDGFRHRYLTAREWQQMAGRAGRRGIDREGYVYSIVDPRDLSYEDVRHATQGEVEAIESQFSLSYSSLLNLYQTYGGDLHEVCRRSFSNYKNVAVASALREQERRLRREVEELNNSSCFFDDFSLIWKYDGALKEAHAVELDIRRAKDNRGKGRRPGGLGELRAKLEGLRGRMADIPCGDCKKRRVCLKTLKLIRKRQTELERAERLARDIEGAQLKEMDRRLDLLRQMGYLNEGGLLPRGKVASQIFGYELQFTELFFDGAFERLDEVQVAIVTLGVVYESRRGINHMKLENKTQQALLEKAERAVMRLQKKELAFDITPPVKAFDGKLSRAMAEWCGGCAFEELKRFTGEDEGDLVRSFRLTVDFLRQMKRAIDEPVFRDRLSRTIALIYRDVVDAEAQLSMQME